jgi:hypothetical protein
LLVAILLLLWFLKQTEIALKNFLNLPMHTASIDPATITAVLAMHPWPRRRERLCFKPLRLR